MISDADIDKALSYLRDTADKAAAARGNVALTAEFIKIVRARVKSQQSGLSNAAAEDVAMTSEEYEEAVRGHAAAVEEDARYRMLREAAAARIEAWRTQSSNARAEGKAYS